MKHWSVNTSALRKDPRAYAVWKLEQAINFGIRKGRISRKKLAEHWHEIDIDPAKRRFLGMLISR